MKKYIRLEKEDIILNIDDIIYINCDLYRVYMKGNYKEGDGIQINLCMNSFNKLIEYMEANEVIWRK